MKMKFTYSITSKVSLAFAVVADDEEGAISRGEDRFHVWIEKATKNELAEHILRGTYSSKPDLRIDGVSR